MEGKKGLKNNKIYSFASIGNDPQDLKYKGEIMNDKNIKELLEKKASLIRQPNNGDYTDLHDEIELAYIEGEIAVIEQKVITKFYKDIIAEMMEEWPVVEQNKEEE